MQIYDCKGNPIRRKVGLIDSFEIVRESSAKHLMESVPAVGFYVSVGDVKEEETDASI